LGKLDWLGFAMVLCIMQPGDKGCIMPCLGMSIAVAQHGLQGNSWCHVKLGRQLCRTGKLSWDLASKAVLCCAMLCCAVQMHKEVPPPRSWRPLVIRHQAFVARVYVSADKQTLSSKSCIQRPGMHDMGAISGYRSSRATSNLTTGSASNASYGTAANEEQQQQDDDAGSRPQVQKGSAPAAGDAGAAAGGDGSQQQANGVKQEPQQDANGLKQEQPESPMLIDSQQRQQQQANGGQQGGQQQQQVQEEPHQQQDSDEMLIMAPAPAQQEQPFISSAVAAVSGAGLLVSGVSTAAAPMDTS
jgi:hypothetical protein